MGNISKLININRKTNEVKITIRILLEKSLGTIKL